jgi:signal transduction histidine kinase
VGVSAHVEGAEVEPRLPIERETALFRITQEALNNIAKHARAKQVTLTLETLDQRIRLTIADDGSGFDATAPRPAGARMSWGLALMRERVRGVGGDMRIDSAIGKGTTIIAEVPR